MTDEEYVLKAMKEQQKWKKDAPKRAKEKKRKLKEKQDQHKDRTKSERRKQTRKKAEEHVPPGWTFPGVPDKRRPDRRSSLSIRKRK